jgi:hypothetical protein
MSSSRTEALKPIREWESPTSEQFQAEILPIGRPALLRGIARDWPLVAASLDDPRKGMAMLSAHANDRPVEILRAEPEVEGRFHYRDDTLAMNFIRGEATLRAFLAALYQHETSYRPFTIVAQGLIAERYVPGFAQTHPMPFVPSSAEPRLWIGNAAKIATHNDPIDNVAVVAAGRRRFTLFPPEAEANLYMGPEHPTPAGTPVSMVHVTAPDWERFPLFERALAVAEEAELSPGDAVFIPRDWFHHVEALERFNVLVNYWWDSSASAAQA